MTDLELDRAFLLVYDELRRLSHAQLAREADGHTLSTTGLVHEAYLRLAGHRDVSWNDLPHFLAIAASAMRHVLVDHARRAHAAKRGGRPERVSLEHIDAIAIDDRGDLVLAVDEALGRLAQLDERQARVVECRFFTGLTEEETASALGVSVRTAKRDWAKARSWLLAELYPETVR